MKRSRSFLQAAFLSLFAITMAGAVTLDPAAPSEAEEQGCSPGCSQPACDVSCGGPGTGVCEHCRCYCAM